MTTFLLVRHGDTDAVGKTIAGWQSGWHLNAKGRTQVEHLAQRLSTLPIRAVYTSPLERAIETATVIALRHGLEPQLRDEFGEFHFEAWEGMEFQDLAEDPEWIRFNTCRSSVRAPGGEMMLETQARMMAQLHHLRQQHAGDTVAIVSHGDPLRCVVASYMGIALDMLLRFEISPASTTTIRIGDCSVQVLCVNQTGDVSA